MDENHLIAAQLLNTYIIVYNVYIIVYTDFIAKKINYCSGN